jgi:crossover junction endodeoxyribonuclease RuvC
MVGNFVTLPPDIDSLDATDGLAAALCHHFKAGRPESKKSYNSWKNFISDNPQRVQKK